MFDLRTSVPSALVWSLWSRLASDQVPPLDVFDGISNHVGRVLSMGHN